MVPFVDIELLRSVARQLDGLATVVWAPPDAAKQILAADETGVSGKTPQEKENLPGVAIFRTSTERDRARDGLSEPAVGWPTTHKAQDGRDRAVLVTQRRRNVLARYTFTILCREYPQQVKIERIINFLDVYRPVIVTYNTAGKEEEHVFPVHLQPPSYSQELDDQTGKIKLYRIDWAVSVPTYWVLSEEWNTVRQVIATWYASLTSGEPITDTSRPDFAEFNERLQQERLTIDEAGDVRITKSA